MMQPQRTTLAAWLTQGVANGFITPEQAQRAMPEKDFSLAHKSRANRQALDAAKPGTYHFGAPPRATRT
jgi:hypothetical protein